MVQPSDQFEMRGLISTLRVRILIRQLLGIKLGRLNQYPPQTLSISRLSPAKCESYLPTISLVTPSFNQAKFVRLTIDSVRVQNYPSLQYIVQDACSTDGTEKVLKSFIDKDIDIRIESDQGQADALNRGFSRTSADIMGYLNSDDLLLPGTLDFIARYFHENPLVDVIYGNRLIIDESGSEIGRWILPGHDAQILRFVDYVPQESMFWRRRIWERVGSHFDASLQFAMDWDLILRFLDAGAIFHHVPELFGIFRCHDKQKSQTSFADKGAKEIAALRLRHRDDNLSGLEKAILHSRYLYQHRKADSEFEASL